MSGFLIRLVVNGLALWVASAVVPGIRLSGIAMILLAALVFGVVNALIRPILLAATCLINLMTLGLFTFVVNALMLLLTAVLVDRLVASGVAVPGHFQVDGFIPALLGAIVISIVSFAVSHVVHD